MKEDWEYKKLSDIYDVRDGTHDSPSYIPNGFPLVTSKNLCNGKIDMSNINYISEDDYHKINERSKVDVGDVLFAMIGTIGNPVLITEEPKFAIKNMALFKVPFNQSGKYLFYLLSSKVTLDKMKEESRGGTQKFVSLKYLRNFKIRLPKIEVQQHIVEELDLLSSIIEKKKAQLNELDNLAQSLFYEMFGDPITNEKGWSYKKLNTLIDENVITYHLDGNHGGDYPRSEEFVDEGVPYIGANSLNNGFVNFSMAKYLPKERAAKLKKGLAINGDVLFAHNATVGPVAYLITNEPLVILSTSLTAYRCNQDKMNPLFLRAYMQSIWFESQYKASMKQTTRNQIPITQQKKFDFILPPISLQNQFAEKIKVIEHQKELIKQSIKEVETLFNSRMDYYFN